MLRAKIRSLLSSILRRAQVEDSMAEELRFHMEARANDLISRGMAPRDAMRQARMEFGSVEKYKEEVRQARGLRFFDEVRGDIRYAFRQLWRNKAFSLVTLLMLAIGIGANTAAFSQLNDVLMKPLPVRQPNELRHIGYYAEKDGFRRGGNAYQSIALGYGTSFSYPAYQYLRDRTTTFSDLFCLSGPQTVNVGVPGRAESAKALLVSGNYFGALGLQAALGRTLLPDDDQPGAAAVTVLSYGFWQRVLGGDSGVVGRTLVVNGGTVVIAGVAPRGFQGMNPDWQPDLMLPMAMQSVVTAGQDVLRDAGYWNFLIFGRLRSGENEERARSEMETLLQQAILANPPDRPYDPPTVKLVSAARGFRGFDAESPAILSAAVVGVILLIACANIAGLLLARATARRREIGTRLAMGAPRGRIVRQLITESVLLSMIGGFAGTVFAITLTGSSVEANLYVLSFALVLSVFTGLVFGLAPAVSAARTELLTMLKHASHQPSGRLSHFRSGKALVTVQVALSLLLLIGAGLFLRTLFNLKGQALGFEPENLLVFRMNPSLNGYRDERLANFYEDALKRIQAQPGVLAASLSRWGVLTMSSSGERVCVPGHDPAGVSTHPVAPRYLETMRIPLLVGRDIDWNDREKLPRVAVVNEAFAKRFYGEKNPIGESFEFGCSTEQKGLATEIVGVAGNTKYFTIRDSARPAVYLPYRQGRERWMTFAIRTTEDPEAMLPAIRNGLAEMDPNLPIYDVATQRQWIDLNVVQERRFAVMLVVLGSIAVLLSCAGIYGTLAYLVNRRTSEIGVRMALGARRHHVVEMILRESLIPVGIGIALGLAAAFALTRLVGRMLFGVQPVDPLTMIAAVMFLVLTSVLAAFLPARRASRIDPMTALRTE